MTFLLIKKEEWLLPFLFNQPKPRIDYVLKAVGGSLTAIPGLSDMIDVSIKMVSSSILFLLFSHHTDSAVLFIGYCRNNCHRYATMAP